ncbi:DUF3592 domain-containing protein [Alterisphingorhabdus coralli]|uniref:DUF3592 domain-containing protein n=1 Tax=Alterisphingorhabdus coralli TaxID=3071408 RepID=A0AA97F5Q5_9SPHN|nr:DUF3592 domain-containing protein [Parasphingorhabdus sp. SCSIO 66989]WOE74711.1 DUF3592 domain-containing protein [Parasphingorhabdus sp. SCSIO 66989]
MGKVGWWLGGIFFAFGLLFMGTGGGIAIHDQQFAGTAERATGTVTDIRSSRGARRRSQRTSRRRTYKPVVNFEDAQGQRHEFVSSHGSNPSSYEIGDSVDVLYDPASPADAMIDSDMERGFLPLLFLGLGGVFAAIGGGFLYVGWRRKKTIAALKLRGKKIMARVISCERDTSIKINGRSPYRVTAQAEHPATGKISSFRSDPVWVDLSDALDGQEVPVLVNPRDWKEHYIDLSQWVDGSARA